MGCDCIDVCPLSPSQNNVAMLLETNYRDRLHMVTNAVKKRLDYQIALQHLHRQMEQEHLINWVEKKVISSITPQQVGHGLWSMRSPQAGQEINVYVHRLPWVVNSQNSLATSTILPAKLIFRIAKNLSGS